MIKVGPNVTSFKAWPYGSIKLAHAMGAKVIVFTTSTGNVEDAKKLGANEVVVTAEVEIIPIQTKTSKTRGPFLNVSTKICNKIYLLSHFSVNVFEIKRKTIAI